LHADSFFTGLQPCDVPGLRERVLSHGSRTIAYAGEFSPTPAIPWVPGKTRIYFYVVSGAGIARIGGFTQPIHAGDFLTLPAGTRHAISAIAPMLRAVYVEESS
jgi:quercetin dioxygenase-like cupin family protein